MTRSASALGIVAALARTAAAEPVSTCAPHASYLEPFVRVGRDVAGPFTTSLEYGGVVGYVNTTCEVDGAAGTQLRGGVFAEKITHYFAGGRAEGGAFGGELEMTWPFVPSGSWRFGPHLAVGIILGNGPPEGLATRALFETAHAFATRRSRSGSISRSRPNSPAAFPQGLMRTARARG